MSVQSGFFNSVNGDRVYNADSISNFFDGVLDEGVFKNYDGELAVTAGADLSVNVAGGKVMLLSKFILNTGQLHLVLSGATTLPRYDAVVIGVDLENRTGDIYIVNGLPAATPSYPTMANTSTKKELCLAYVYVAAGATSITSANITDKRSDPSVCGYVKLTNVSAGLEVSRNNVSLSGTNIQNVSLGIPSFDASTDMLFVYLNGMLLLETTDYTIVGAGSQATIQLVNRISMGSSNVITAVVYRITV